MADLDIRKRGGNISLRFAGATVPEWRRREAQVIGYECFYGGKRAMKQLFKVIAIGLVCLGSTGAVLAGSLSEECVTRKLKDVFSPTDSSFATVVTEVNAIADAQPVRPGLRAERARIDGGAEYVRVEMISTICNSDKGSVSIATAKCSTLGCETSFPGTNAPLGATMVIESCASGILTKGTYTRVSSGGSLTWRLTDLHESELGTCPRLKQPGMGGN